MIGAALMLLERKDTDGLVKALSDLAERHSTYGVQPHHYAPVGISLLAAFEHTLAKEQWTDESKAAWLEIYSLMCTVMIPVSVRTCKSGRDPSCGGGVGMCAAGGDGASTVNENSASGASMQVPPKGTASEDPTWKKDNAEPDDLDTASGSVTPNGLGEKSSRIKPDAVEAKGDIAKVMPSIESGSASSAEADGGQSEPSRQKVRGGATKSSSVVPLA